MNSTPLNNNTDEEEDPFESLSRFLNEGIDSNKTSVEETTTQTPVVENELLSSTIEPIQKPINNENKQKEEEDPFDSLEKFLNDSSKPKETGITGITEEEDESWINAFKQSIGQPLDAIADTADVFGFKKTAELLQAVSPDVDENYVSAGYRFMNPKEDDFTILGFAPEYIPRAIAEQTGQIAGSIITAAAGRAVGAAIGSAAGPKGTIVGGIAGGLAGPFIFEAMQIAGPAIKERAKNQGREEPSWDDISWGLSTAAGSGALNALGQKYLPGGDKAVGTFVNKFVKGATSEGVTETAQSLLQQTGETLLTEKGLEIKPKEAIGEGLIGASAGGTFAAALAPLTGKEEVKPEEVKPTEGIKVEEQEAILPKPPITEEERGVVSIRVTPKIQAIEEAARKEEEAKAKVVPTTETDATKSATERLKTKSRELEQKNIPNEALKVVEAQIEQVKPTAVPAAKRAEDILNEKRPLLERQDIKPIDLDETTLSKLKRAADNTADDTTISELKDKGLVYEVEGNIVIPEEARLSLGSDSRLSEIERLEQIRDRFKITEEELNNSTDDELAASVRITQNAVGRLPEIPAIRANESLNRLREELLRRSQQPVESKAGKRMVVDKNTLTGIGNTTAATAFVSNTVNREIEGGLSVDLVNPVSGKVTRITGFDNTRRKLIGNDLKTKRRTSIPMGSILDGQSRLEIFNPKTARSRQDNEITEPVVRKFEPLVSPKELEVKATEEIKSTPLEGFESVEETKVEASRKANVLRELKAESPKDFLTNVARRGGIKQKVADLLIRSGGLENAAIKIGRFGRATDRNQRFAGKYNRVTNEITINLDERDSYTNEDGTHDVESTLLHELGHAAFANKLANKETLDPAESKAVREIESIYEKFKERYNDTRADYSNNTQNAFNNLQEFGSEVLVNPELQNLVADLTPDKSLLQKVLQYILNFIQGKEINPYNELSQSWQALNTLTGRPAVTAEAEVTTTVEPETTPVEAEVTTPVEAEVTPTAEPETTPVEGELLSPATDVIKRIFPNTPKRAYTKDFKNWLLRLFTTGNRNQIVQRAVEWIEGKLNSYRFQMESVVKRLKTAAEKDGVNFDDVAEALNKALARNPDDLTEAQRAEIDTIVLNAGNQAIEQFLNGTTETSPTGVNIDGVEFTLPEELKKSSPKYGMGKIQFFSDFDKAAYIIAKDTGKLSKADAKFRKAVQDAGYDIDEVIEHGNKIKAELKKLAGGTAPRTAMNLDLLPQKFDGQSKPYTDRKVKSKSRELTDAELTQIQEAIDATGISPTEAAERVLGEKKFNRLKNYVETVKKQARIDAELEFNKQNLDRAYKEADDALNALPENLRNQILEARAEIKEVTGGVVHDGVIPPNARVVIDGKKVNIAIKEAYYATLDENFIKKLKMDPERIDSLIQYAQDTWINNRANELINESLTNMTRKEAKDLATTELNRLTDEGEINLQDTIESFLNIAATNPTKGFEELLAPSLKMTPDQQAHGLTKALKEALGRVDDNVGYTYISMMHNIAQEITYSEGFNMMRESGLRDGWVVDIKSGDLIPEGFVPIEKSSIPGFSKAFEGTMVDPLFKQEIENTYDSGGKMDGIQKGLNAFNGVTLAAATSLSLPRGPIRNFLGNILFYISAGRIDPRPLAKGMKVAIAALQQSGDAEIIARLKRLIELNLIDQDVTMDILRNSVKGFKGEDINMLENLGQTLKPSNIAKVGKFLNRLYQLPDNMWKIALQIAEETTLTEAYKDGIPAKDAGTEVDITFGTPEFKTKIEELAADRVKEAMPAYARMNPIGRFFRKPGMRAFVAPFIGFRSEVLRLQVSNLNLALRDSRSSNPVLRKSGFKRLAGIMASYSSLPIIAAMTKAIFGIGDEEEEAARRTLATWDQNAELIFYRDKDRNLKYYNMSFANPFAGSSTDALRAARRNYEMNDEKGAKAMTQAIARGLWETFGAYVDPQIFTKKAIEAYSNVSDDGRPVYNPESGPGQIGWDIAGHLYSGIEPGTFKQGMGLINAIMGKEDRRGEIPSLGPAIFNTFLVRSGDVRPAEAFKYKSLEINRRKRDAARIITSLVKRPGPVSDEEITTAYNQANEAYYSILSNANRLYNDQLILGTNKREIITLLKEAGISGDEINQIRRGYIKPYEISDSTLRVIPRDRARLLQKLYREQRRRLASDSNVLTNPKGTNRPNQ